MDSSTVVADKKTSMREMRFVTLTPFREADGVGLDKVTRKAKCIIITEGLGNLRDKNYYTAEAIESAAVVFQGKQFYIDHPSESEESDRPERSIYDLAGWFGECKLRFVPDPATGQRLRACFADLQFDSTEAGSTAMGKVEAALAYQKQFPNSKDVYAGISINGGGISHPGTIRGMQVNLVTEIQEAFSADIVTKPARGGRFLALIREAAKAAAWSRSQTQQRREASPRTGAEGGQFMATAVLKGRSKEAGKDPKKAKEKDPKQQEAQAALQQETITLLREVKALKRSVREAEAQDNLEAVVEVATEKLKAAGVKFAKAKKTADAAGGDVADILMDIQQDIGELSKSLGLGGGAEELPEGDMPEEVPEEVPEGDMPPEGGGDPELVAAEGEEEGEQEKEKEGEEEAEGTAAEGEEEAEGGEKEAFGDDDDDDDEGNGDLGMSDEAGDKAGGQRMQFKCAKCATVNEVAPPEGYQLARTGETMGESERQLHGRITMIERQLEAKEGRFVKTNRNLATALKENQKLAIELRKAKSKIIAFDRMEEASKQLKEANIPADILPAKDLVTLYEPEQWEAAIKQAKNMLEREAKLSGKNLAPAREAGGLQGTGKDGEVTGKDLSTKFHEAYSGKSEDKDK